MGYSLERRRSQFMTEMEHLFIFFADTWRLLKLMGLRSKQFEKKKNPVELIHCLSAVSCVSCAFAYC